MRFAVIANIQGNLAALESVLEAITERHRNVDRIICAGDIVGLGPQPNEVLDLLQAKEVESVRGNYDDAVAIGREESGTDFADPEAEEADALALAWTQRRVTPANLQYLRALPRDLRLSPGGTGVKVDRNQADERQAEYKRTFFVRAMFGGILRNPVSTWKRVLVVHGSPRALNEFIRQDSANSILSAIGASTQTDVLISGHAGASFRREAHGITFVGAGRVSDPTGQRGTADYIIVTTGDEVEVEVGHADYDAAAYKKLVAMSRMPAPFLSRY